MKALWKGNISLALVTIPVKLYGATKKKDISFHLLHRECSSPIKYEKFCPVCNRELFPDEIARAYEYEKGRYVIIEDRDIESIPVSTSKNINIIQFINETEIDPLYYERTYYLEPGEGGERAYVLLREAMKTTRTACLAKITLREREHIAILRVLRNLMALHTLYYADEVVQPESINVPEKIDLTPEETSLAIEIVKRFRAPLHLEEYHDEFREALMELIKSKIEGREIKVAPAEEVAKITNLMEALKKSLEQKKKTA